MPDRRTLGPSLLCTLALFLLAACGHQDDDIDIIHDPCAPLTIAAPGVSGAQAASIAEATQLWNERGTMLEFVDEPTDDADDALLIEFEDAAPMFKGIYLDEAGDIVINSRLTDSKERTIVIAHELGHAFGMGHIDDRVSVMNSGNLSIKPGEGDVARLEKIWPDCDL